MEDLDQTGKVGELASGYFGSGFHCAEAVAKAVLESLGHDANAAVAHATAFGGGFGGTYCEACGALSGGLLAIGHLHGRCEPAADWDLPAELAAMDSLLVAFAVMALISSTRSNSPLGLMLNFPSFVSMLPPAATMFLLETRFRSVEISMSVLAHVVKSVST